MFLSLVLFSYFTLFSGLRLILLALVLGPKYVSLTLGSGIKFLSVALGSESGCSGIGWFCVSVYQGQSWLWFQD